MLSPHSRSTKCRKFPEEEVSYTSTTYPQQRHATADFTETEDDDLSDEERGSRCDTDDDEEDDEDADNDDDDDDEDDDVNEDGEEANVLPIFSAAHLDALPVYSLTHAIRLIVLPRTETTLTWDQLRSPQVSQFLVKPMQQQIRTSHFTRATLYALMANCLQFQKESQSNPGTAGTCKTRALVCELLAIKLLKEFNIRELIDALSYDFFPLQGVEDVPGMGRVGHPRNLPAIVRTSTLEIAIRASAKRFLSQPLVIQQLESIWAGTIVFHSHADNLHRREPAIYRKPPEMTHLPVSTQRDGYGTLCLPEHKTEHPPVITPRRTVTLYNPRDASLFKLSRLRVPRYRQFFSTCSLAILLGLFVAVLSRRSMEITTLEVIFWFWSAGFMLDEVVGFNEQGFSLYIMSFWNAFDLGILLLLSVYYCMRLYGIFLMDVGRQEWNSMAYDVLATNAILLFPRLFSLLDHHRYFSQLLIGFRLMAIDLVAVFVLILIACSGFFVAFTLSFSKNDDDAAEVAYRIFQILMGFTPAAWEVWPTYNPLGRALLILFLFICHFLVVTILITVLTNSFMAIASNADQEHQFVFAVNTISMVKNDALFSYVAPSNILAWVLTPIRFCVPFRLFIKMNRTAIKLTHFPLLFAIFSYEKMFLAGSLYEPTDLIERGRNKGLPFQDRTMRLRQESAAGYKDQVLDEVFRFPPRPDTLRKSMERKYTRNVVKNWMNQQPYPNENNSLVDRTEKRPARNYGNRSVASDPVVGTNGGPPATNGVISDEVFNDRDDDPYPNDDLSPKLTRKHTTDSERTSSGAFSTLKNGSIISTRHEINAHKSNKPLKSTKSSQQKSHNRNLSKNTIIYNPISDSESGPAPPKTRPIPPKNSAKNSGTVTPGSGLDRKTPKSSFHPKSYPHPIMQPTVMNNNLDTNMTRTRQMRQRRFSLEMGTSQIGIDPGMMGAVPNSFATQMAMATGALKNAMGNKDDEGMMGRLMLARMKTLEEGFAEVVKEFRVMRTAGSSPSEENENWKKRR